MNKKLILLILCLPLVLMLSLFTVSNTTKILINIPVSSIEIIGDSVVYIDFDSERSYFVDYVIYPTNAKNQNVSFKTEKVGSSPLAELEYNNGYITAKSCGRFKDSFIVDVSSNKLSSISSNMNSTTLYVGQPEQIYTQFNPSDSIYTSLKYSSSNPDIADVSATGVVTGKKIGTATITIKSLIDETIFDTINICVENGDIIALPYTQITTWENSGLFEVSLDLAETTTFAVAAYNQNGESLDSSIINLTTDESKLNENVLSVEYTFTNQSFFGDVQIIVTAHTVSGDQI